MSIQRLLTKNGVLNNSFIPADILPDEVDGPVYGQLNPIDLSTQQVGYNLEYNYINAIPYPITATPKTYSVFPNSINLPAGVFLVWGSISFNVAEGQNNLQTLEAEILLSPSTTLTNNSIAWNYGGDTTPQNGILEVSPKIFNTAGLDKLNIVIKIQNTTSTLRLQSVLKLIRLA